LKKNKDFKSFDIIQDHELTQKKSSSPPPEYFNKSTTKYSQKPIGTHDDLNAIKKQSSTSY